MLIAFCNAFTLPHSVALARIDHCQIVVSARVCRIDFERFVESLNGVRQILLRNQLVRFVELLPAL